MHEQTQHRTLDQIDHDLQVERALLAYEQRAGRTTTEANAAWSRIDTLLEERLSATQPLPDLQGAPPRGQHGGLVR